MTSCDRCGKATREVYPLLDREPSSFNEDRPLSRLALYALGAKEPKWGDHPDDGQFIAVCRACAGGAA